MANLRIKPKWTLKSAEEKFDTFSSFKGTRKVNYPPPLSTLKRFQTWLNYVKKNSQRSNFYWRFSKLNNWASLQRPNSSFFSSFSSFVPKRTWNFVQEPEKCIACFNVLAAAPISVQIIYTCNQIYR